MLPGTVTWLTQLESPKDEVNPYDTFIEAVGPLAMGATTYEWIRRHYPNEWLYGDRPTWVFTHRDLPAIEGANLIFTAADVAEVHADMVAAAAEGKNIWLVGGGDLVRQFAERDCSTRSGCRSPRSPWARVLRSTTVSSRSRPVFSAVTAS